MLRLSSQDVGCAGSPEAVLCSSDTWYEESWTRIRSSTDRRGYLLIAEAVEVVSGDRRSVVSDIMLSCCQLEHYCRRYEDAPWSSTTPAAHSRKICYMQLET